MIKNQNKVLVIKVIFHRTHYNLGLTNKIIIKNKFLQLVIELKMFMKEVQFYRENKKK